MALTDNLTAYYKLDGNSTDIFGNNGTDTNITYSAANGKLTQGAGFNGLSSYIINGANLDLSATNKISISFWVKFTSVGALVLFEQSTNYNSNNAFIININAGKIEAGQHTTGASYNAGATAVTLNDGNWHHILVVYDRSLSGSAQTNIYLDGATSFTSTLSTTLSGNFGAFRLYIGARAGTSLFFNSAIDEIGIWSRALSADEAKDLYLNGNGSGYPFRDKGFLMM
jgi:hypothetical protein